MLKALHVLIAVLSLASIWLDPFTYTLHPAGPERSPLWWQVFSVIDTAVLVAFVWRVLTANWRRAYMLMALSTVLTLFMNGLYVWLRGVDRFLIRFGTTEILSLFLVLSALRVVAMFTCGIAAMNRVHRLPASDLDRG